MKHRILAAVFTATLLLTASSAAAFTPAAKAPAAQSDVTLVATQQRKPPKQFWRTKVRLKTNEAPGTIIVDTNNKYLYLVEGPSKATRYGIGVGREGFGWSGVVKVQRKAEWPTWIPPKEMIARERKRGHILPAKIEGEEGNLMNPLGARALYIFKDGQDTLYRLHGSPEWKSIGKAVSSGCVRMLNQDVMDLYDRVRGKAPILVI